MTRKEQIAATCAARRRRLEAGLCLECIQPVAPGRRRCPKHLAAGREKYAANYEPALPKRRPCSTRGCTTEVVSRLRFCAPCRLTRKRASALRSYHARAAR